VDPNGLARGSKKPLPHIAFYSLTTLDLHFSLIAVTSIKVGGAANRVRHSTFQAERLGNFLYSLTVQFGKLLQVIKNPTI